MEAEAIAAPLWTFPDPRGTETFKNRTAAGLLGADEEALGRVPTDLSRLAHHVDGGFALEPDAFAELFA